ncbi:MAG TPA: BON domain-containing protein, partial [Pyrinomonadaceae bacterium]|nr:BON domain-containing protein [Pyrinomonadaceae bacterium]
MKTKLLTTMFLIAAMLAAACGKSDADLAKAATDKLTAEKISDVSVTVSNGEATLSGEVADITVKNKAEAAVKSVEGIKTI